MSRAVVPLPSIWRLDAASIEYRQVGFGSHHWDVAAGGGRWFLTVDDLDARTRSTAERCPAVGHRLNAALAAAGELCRRPDVRRRPGPRRR